MRFSIAAAVPLLAGANAIITGVAVPETIAAGTPFNIIIETANYIQSVYDVAIAVGFAHGDGFPGGSLGNVLDSFYLGPGNSNTATNISRIITLPTGTPQGAGLISASLFSLEGAAYGPVVVNFNVSVAVGSATSKTYKSSQN